jgi:hypothetical protein
MKRIISVILLASASLSLSSCYEVGTGEKNGTITKFAKTGFFCKTWEAEIQRGGLNSGSGVIGAPFDFTVEDPSLVQKVQDAIDSQREVRIHYRSEFNSFCRSDSQDHFLVSIDYVAAGQGGTVRADGKPVVGTNLTPAQVNRLLDQNQQVIDILKTK